MIKATSTRLLLHAWMLVAYITITSGPAIARRLDPDLGGGSGGDAGRTAIIIFSLLVVSVVGGLAVEKLMAKKEDKKRQLQR